MTLLWGEPAFAADRIHRSLVVGASVVVTLGPVERGSRIGGGADVGYQIQRYDETYQQLSEGYAAWVDERPTVNCGPIAHAWWIGGAWNVSLGARVGVGWPLRVGLAHGWYPGPALTVELAPMLSTAGFVALDGQAVVDATWLQGRIGAAVSSTGKVVARRVAVGVLAPVVQPENWPDTPEAVWKKPPVLR